MSTDVESSRKLNHKVDLKAPPLKELKDVIEGEMGDFFREFKVEIVDCPDLSQPPYNLTGKGFSTKVKVAEVGGIGNLVPRIRRDKLYNLKAVADVCETSGAFIFGPGAGPRASANTNCELMADANFGEGAINCRVCKMAGDTYEAGTTLDPCFSILGNFGVTTHDDVGGKVLKITAKGRKTERSFPESIRQVVFQHYRARLVSMVGVFQQKSGLAKVHVMPDFPEKDFADWKEEKEWLRIFTMNAPLQCVSVLHTINPDLDLRLEHTHCYSDHGDMGHYYVDETPNKTDAPEFEGYFSPARTLYRIDQVGNDDGREVAVNMKNRVNWVPVDANAV